VSTEQAASVNRTNSDASSTKIGWTHVPVRRLTAEKIRDYAIETGGRDRISPEFLNEKEEELKAVKKEVMTFAKMHIHMYFLDAFAEMGITHLKTMGDIKNYWATNCMDPMARRVISHVLFGYFDSRVGWDAKLEREFMMRKNWSYAEKVEGSTDKKGCIAKLICEMKVEQTKRIQLVGKSKGVVITIKRKSPEEKEKNRKRTKGLVYFDDSEALSKTNEASTAIGPNKALYSMFQAAANTVKNLEGDNLNVYVDSFIAMLTGIRESNRDNVPKSISGMHEDESELTERGIDETVDSDSCYERNCNI